MPRLIAFLVALICCTQCEAADNSHLLEEGHQTILYVWKQWMKKPDLRFDSISQEALKSFFGSWIGSYRDDDAKVEIDLTLNDDGTWRSKRFRPDMKRGHWYLYKGMIQLYESEISEKASLASILFVRGKEFRMLDADAPKGYIVFARNGSKTAH